MTSDETLRPGRIGRTALEVVHSRRVRPRREDRGAARPDQQPVAPVLTLVRGAAADTTSVVTTLPSQPAVVIGSHPSCDVVLPGLRARHAVVGRDVQGRSVLKALAGGCHVDGSPVVSQVVDEHSDIRVGGRRVSLQQERDQVWCT